MIYDSLIDLSLSFFVGWVLGEIVYLDIDVVFYFMISFPLNYRFVSLFSNVLPCQR